MQGRKRKHIARPGRWPFPVPAQTAAYFPNHGPRSRLLHLVHHPVDGIRWIADPQRFLVLHQGDIRFRSNPVQMGNSPRNTSAVQGHRVTRNPGNAWLVHTVQQNHRGHIRTSAGSNGIALDRRNLLAVPLPHQAGSHLRGSHGRPGLKYHLARSVQRRQIQKRRVHQGVVKQFPKPLPSRPNQISLFFFVEGQGTGSVE